MLDGIDDGDEDSTSFPEHDVLDKKYQEPKEESLEPDIPTVPDPSDRDVDPVVQGTFWTLVVVFNIGLLVVSLGAMFVIFGENPPLGWQLTAVGALILGYGFYRYRSAKQVIERQVTDGEETGDSPGETDSDDRNG